LAGRAVLGPRPGRRGGPGAGRLLLRHLPRRAPPGPPPRRQRGQWPGHAQAGHDLRGHDPARPLPPRPLLGPARSLTAAVRVGAGRAPDMTPTAPRLPTGAPGLQIIAVRFAVIEAPSATHS